MAKNTIVESELTIEPEVELCEENCTDRRKRLYEESLKQG